MKNNLKILWWTLLLMVLFSCKKKNDSSTNLYHTKQSITAKEILGNPTYRALSYGGYREKYREVQPNIDQLKEDLKIISAMGIKIIRTYNVQLDHAKNVLKAIQLLQQENPKFEMYVMLGAWIDCKNAWTDLTPDHNTESKSNASEINRAVALANRYPKIVKIIAVGNEAMVKWATSYYVQPKVILKWVNYLQTLKKNNQLPPDIWITSSDDYSSWGGGDAKYHTSDLEKLVKAVDYISMHTYPYHNTHYNPKFWKTPTSDNNASDIGKIENAMLRSRDFAISQYDSVNNYIKSLGIKKPIHIGETGWATTSSGFYGTKGSRASDEYKQSSYHKLMRSWSDRNKISCFYFEAFNEKWKDADHPNGSENHFGLFTIDGKAKYALWDLVDNGVFKGLTRNGKPITKTYNGEKNKLINQILVPPPSQ